MGTVVNGRWPKRESRMYLTDEERHIIRMVDTLNGMVNSVVGGTSLFHWPLPFNGDPNESPIECFMQGQNLTTNLLGVINAAVSYTDSQGNYNRIAYSEKDKVYVRQTIDKLENQ